MPFVEAAWQRKAIEQFGHVRLGRHCDAHSGRRRLHTRMKRRDDAHEPALQSSVELLAVRALDALGHVGRSEHAEEVHVDRHESVLVHARQRRLEQRSLAVPARPLEPAVTRLGDTIPQQSELVGSIGQGLGRLEWILVDERAGHWCLK